MTNSSAGLRPSAARGHNPVLPNINILWNRYYILWGEFFYSFKRMEPVCALKVA